MPLLPNSTYQPRFPYRGAHSSTLISNILRFPSGVRYERTRVWTEDNDFLDLDWSTGFGDRAVVLSHGLAGNSRSVYIKGMVKYFNAHGWDTCSWNLRGCSGEPNKTPGFYHPMQLGDLHQVIEEMLKRKAYKTIVLAGFSIGAILTLNYLTRSTVPAPESVKAAICFSAPCNMQATLSQFNTGFGKVYGQIFLRKFKMEMRRKEKAMPGTYDLRKMRQLKNLDDFDREFNAGWYGFPSVDAFYGFLDPRPYLSQIKVPTLIVNALNDPFMDASCFPREVAKNHPHLYLETPEHGGHLGFASYNRRTGIWSEQRAMEFLKSVSQPKNLHF